MVATVVACTLALQLGALGVVAQTALSGTAPPALLAASLLAAYAVMSIRGRRVVCSSEATIASRLGTM